MFDEQLETRLHDLFTELLSASAWTAKEDCLQRLAPLIEQHPFELQEALLLAGPTAVLDTLFAITVSQRVQLSSKLLAADVLSALCTNCSRACLLLCPSSLVERLMRCAYKGDADLKAAAARALWQLSCHNDFSPEVSRSHALLLRAVTHYAASHSTKSWNAGGPTHFLDRFLFPGSLVV